MVSRERSVHRASFQHHPFCSCPARSRPHHAVMVVHLPHTQHIIGTLPPSNGKVPQLQIRFKACPSITRAAGLLSATHLPA
eukprot:UN3187